MSKDARSRLIVALDVPDKAAAIDSVDRLAGHVGCFKLGLEIFVREGPRLVEEIRSRGEQVFLDLKLHDIPNTVAGAVRSACALDVQMLTVHAAGGRDMLEAAREAANASAAPPLLLAVTALTSLSQESLCSIGILEPISGWVGRLAGLAYQARMSGLVASAQELPQLYHVFGGMMRFVIPGIRPIGAASLDQKRTASPAEAIRAGADFLVIGRPILQASDPAVAADLVVREIEAASLYPAPSQNS